ncbi:hypothetical protein MPTK1_1g19010 [Marchantia polymorpha subsp. ruderalis]|uniref:Uncharacterized protein n=2 Tax=Marchantia polymorpha TaxID=3197 RepID=A0AAF6ARR3_MARPO|nr:hypothetical protein MARPO_0001s0239 [Marchantia polymorpha]BBM99133.1 hypothetical protein Mp_1g19010 [Marchantia polymorpha subsp. ruderalis]|eukprot:PTQ50210.1 hypothetical protein MARPO_0001s0239 [Marchantia polymorpha]
MFGSWRCRAMDIHIAGYGRWSVSLRKDRGVECTSICAPLPRLASYLFCTTIAIRVKSPLMWIFRKLIPSMR